MSDTSLIGDSTAEDAYDPTGVPDFDAVNRKLQALSRQILAGSRGDSRENEAALAVARNTILLAVERGVRKMATYIRVVGHEENNRADWAEMTTRQCDVARLLIAVTLVWLGAEGSLT